MAFPLYVSKDACLVDVDRTFTADTYDDYTDACAAFDMTISYAVPSGHYLDCVYIGVHGASTNNGYMWGLWIDNDWSGTNSGTYYLVRMSHQGGGTPPNAFIQFQDAAEVPYLFYLVEPALFVKDGAISGSQNHKIAISLNGTDMFIPLYTA